MFFNLSIRFIHLCARGGPDERTITEIRRNRLVNLQNTDIQEEDNIILMLNQLKNMESKTALYNFHMHRSCRQNSPAYKILKAFRIGYRRMLDKMQNFVAKYQNCYLSK